MNELNKRAFGGLGRFLIIMAAMLFLPAWTVKYWQGWIFLGVFGVSVVAISVYLMKHDSKLLERRLKAGPTAEKEKSQKIIQGFASVTFIAAIIVPAIDHRLGWSAVPVWVVAAGDILVAVGLLIVFLVFRENTFTSSTIELHEEQRVVSTGPYAMVRHPMYAGALVMMVGMPLALGSWWGLLASVAIAGLIVWRLIDEEKFLGKSLAGYEGYRKMVKYRLVPGIW
jgi:protein-S-isoprenylcysteine O-methyltransferase Ste14